MKLSRKLTLIIALMILISVVPISEVSANNDSFSVHRLTYNASTKKVVEGSSLLTTSDFNAAKSKMLAEAKVKEDVVIKYNNSKSPMKYVAADKGMVQSYPYRDGVTLGKRTLDINRSPNLDSGSTYIEAHYKLYLEDTVKSNKGIVHKVSFQGIDGWYVENNKVDIIPHIYIKHEAVITIGGNEEYYDRETNFEPDVPYEFRPKYDKYVVSDSGELYVKPQWTYISKSIAGEIRSVGPYGKVPKWLKSGEYFSKDGISFYKDFDFKQPVKDDSGKTGKYYPYYVWLPLKTKSHYSGDNFRKVIAQYGVMGEQKIEPIDGSLSGNEQLFVEHGQKFGINPLLLFAQAAQETGWGTSNLSVNKHNLFGWNAVDSDPNQAKEFLNVEQSISEQAYIFLRRYLTPQFEFHYGTSFGNKGSGITMKYASDPFYGEKIAAIAYDIDKENGFKDYDAYQLAVLKDKSSVPFKRQPNNSSKNWYSTEDILINQMVAILGAENGYFKTNLHVPIHKDNALLDIGMKIGPHISKLNSEFGYVASANASRVDQAVNNNKIPTEEVIVDVESYPATVQISRDLKSEWRENSRTITTLKKGDVVKVSNGDNGWSKVYLGETIGYVPTNSLSNGGGTPSKPETGLKPHEGSKFSNYRVDTKNYADLNIRELPNSDSSTKVIGSLLDGQIISASPYEGDWFITKVGNKYGFVHSDYLVLVQDKPAKTKKGDLNMNGKIDLVDLAMLQSHLLKINILSDELLDIADVDNSGQVDLVDLARIQSHLLKINFIKE